MFCAFSILKDKRNFSKGKDGDKGYVEADHIPPLDSLRRAAQQPAFQRLRSINRGLYDMVRSLENDPRGMNLFTIQVPTHNHRAALSTGRGRESVAARYCPLPCFLPIVLDHPPILFRSTHIHTPIHMQHPNHSNIKQSGYYTDVLQKTYGNQQREGEFPDVDGGSKNQNSILHGITHVEKEPKNRTKPKTATVPPCPARFNVKAVGSRCL